MAVSLREAESATVRGRSMEPYLFEGDLLQLTPVPADEVREGAIYCYETAASHSRISHRCVAIQEGGDLAFQGDRQPATEAVARGAAFWRVDRVLERRRRPDASAVVLGLLRDLDRIDDFEFPAHVTLHWPWQAIFDFARKHRVLTAVGYALKASALWAVCPPELRERLSLDLYQATERLERIGLVRERLSRLLPEGRFLKGAALGDLYPIPIVRTLSDVDILVPEEGYFEAIERLGAQGFSISEEWRRQARIFHEAQLRHEATGIVVEVHRSLFQKHRYRFDSAHFLRQGDALDELLYLCAHALTHFGSHVRSYWDIFRYLLTRRPPLEGAAARARERGALLAYAFALRLLRDWWNVDFDADAAALLNPRQRASLGAATTLYAGAMDIEMLSLRKQLLQTLVADDLASLTRLIFDPGRIYVSYLAGRFGLGD